ncbi:MAG TPA: glycosyltransferase family 4 protein [Conexibacter sp.]|nr:glycosyltransferase family 4 protein [Conexibacter sp.]
MCPPLDSPATVPGEQPSCVIRGDHGGGHSLAHVNDGLGAALEARGHRIARSEPHAGGQLELPCPTISHCWPPDFGPGSSGPTIAVLPWEVAAPPRAWVHAVRERCDRVWVPSGYVRDGYVGAGMPPGIVDVVPNGVDLERFAPDGPARAVEGDSAGSERCTFLFVGGTIWRKGIDVLLAAWQLAFDAGDDVRLVVKDFGVGSVYRGQTMGEEVRALAARDDAAPVIYLDGDVPAAELPALYRAADVVVLPYRGEGFCLPALEAMACGVPVIHTAAGPTGEFCTPGTGWPLPSRRVEFDARTYAGPTSGRAVALEVDAEQLAVALRAAAAAPLERLARGIAARRAAERMSWDAAAAIAELRLAELAATTPPRWARAIVVPAIETRGTAVLYAPDWDHPDVWEPVLRDWAMSFHAGDDATLVLAVSPERHDAVAPRVLACLTGCDRGQESLPDVLLDAPAPGRLDGLVARCDAVLLDATHVGPARELLTRRALRTLTAEPDALDAFAVHLRGTRRIAAPLAA